MTDYPQWRLALAVLGRPLVNAKTAEARGIMAWGLLRRAALWASSGKLGLDRWEPYADRAIGFALGHYYYSGETHLLRAFIEAIEEIRANPREGERIAAKAHREYLAARPPASQEGGAS